MALRGRTSRYVTGRLPHHAAGRAAPGGGLTLPACLFQNKGGDADWTGLIGKPDAPRCYDEAPSAGEIARGFLLSPCRVMSSRAAGDCRGPLRLLWFCRVLSGKRKPHVTL
jgi:hypothetical protein